MIRRRNGSVALIGWLVSVAIAIAAGLITPASDLSFVLIGPIFTTVGAALAWRRPENVVGWLLELFGFLVALIGFTQTYALRGLVDAPDSLPAATTAAWLSVWVFVLLFGVVCSIFLLFPNGRLPSPRWRVVLWAQWVLVAVFLVGAAFFDDTLGFFPGYHNPYLIVPLPSLAGLTPSLMLPNLAAALSLVLRARRARGDERQQLKWVGYAVALFTLSFVGGASLNGLVAFGLLEPNTLASDAFGVVAFGSFLGVPLAIAVAVLRYRLYDIDVLINRTLVYAALSATLAATYFAAVVVLQAALRPLTGGSEVAVALSTLSVVALFAPLRRRIQGAVDRRFYRSRYDAQRTFDAFGVRLRDEVDLDSVRADLLEVVHETLRPAHAGVWLREARR
jgi:hypothetical protein